MKISFENYFDEKKNWEKSLDHYFEIKFYRDSIFRIPATIWQLPWELERNSFFSLICFGAALT